MNLNNLDCFLVLSETLSFTQTAKQLNLTQPSVSRQIKQLEDDVSAQLFYRDRHKVRLTPEGKDLKAKLQPLYREMEKVFLQSREKTERVEGDLLFCCYPEVGQYFFMKILLEFQKTHTGLGLHVDYCLDDAMIEKLKSGQADFAVMGRPVIAENLRSYKLLDERSVAVTRTSNKTPWPSSQEEFEASHFVGYDRRDRLLVDFLKNHSKLTDFSHIGRLTTVNSHKSMLDVLTASDAFALLPTFSVEEQLKNKTLKLAHPKDLHVTLYLVYPESSHLSKKNAAFREFLIQACKKQGSA